MTTARTFDVRIGDRETTIRLFPRHLESVEAECHRDAFTGEINAEALALARAVRKLYGPRASWWEDSGVRGFGLVTVPHPATRSHTCVTPRVRATVVSR